MACPVLYPSVRTSKRSPRIENKNPGRQQNRKDNSMAKNKIPKLAISHNFSSTKVPDLLTQAQKVYTNVNAASTTTFPNPPVPLTQIQADITALTGSSAAATDGSKKDIAQRNK